MRGWDAKNLDSEDLGVVASLVRRLEVERFEAEDTWDSGAESDRSMFT